MSLDFAKEALENIDQLDTTNASMLIVKNGWHYCTCCGYLNPLPEKEREELKKEGHPPGVWQLKKGIKKGDREPELEELHKQITSMGKSKKSNHK